MPPLKRFTVVTGHYGCGKTNLSINLALDLAREGREVTLVDLDIVNPYFRSSDSRELLTQHGVRLIAPTFAGTTLETPSLPAEIYSAFQVAGPVIFDVGGDDAGATTLGRYAQEVAALDYELLYVINRYRNLTSTPAEASALLAEIEAASHLKATGIVNNSHLQAETTAQTVLDSLEFGRETAGLLGLPLVATTVPAHLAHEFAETPGEASYVENAYPVVVYVRTPWHDPLGVAEEVI
jgi:hypothetical protein